MNWWERVTGSDINRELKRYEVRAEQLPAAYQTAWDEIKKILWEYSDFTGRNLMPVLENVLFLLEETSAEGQTVEEALGEDIKGFCSAMVGEEGAKTYRDRWREQLNANVARKLGRKEKK